MKKITFQLLLLALVFLLYASKTYADISVNNDIDYSKTVYPIEIDHDQPGIVHRKELAPDQKRLLEDALSCVPSVIIADEFFQAFLALRMGLFNDICKSLGLLMTETNNFSFTVSIYFCLVRSGLGVDSSYPNGSCPKDMVRWVAGRVVHF